MIALRGARRRKIQRATWLALLFSLLIHLVSVLAVAWVYLKETPPPGEEITEIEITFVEPPAPQQRQRAGRDQERRGGAQGLRL